MMGWRPSLQKEVQNAGQYLKPAHCSVLLVLGQDADPGSPRRREVQPGGTRLPLRHRRKNLCFSPRPRSWRPQKTRAGHGFLCHSFRYSFVISLVRLYRGTDYDDET